MSRFPWWGSVLLAVAVYCGLKYGLPSMLPDNHRLQELLELLAPLAAMALLLLAGKQLYDHPPAADDGSRGPSDDDQL